MIFFSFEKVLRDTSGSELEYLELLMLAQAEDDLEIYMVICALIAERVLLPDQTNIWSQLTALLSRSQTQRRGALMKPMKHVWKL